MQKNPSNVSLQNVNMDNSLNRVGQKDTASRLEFKSRNGKRTVVRTMNEEAPYQTKPGGSNLAAGKTPANNSYSYQNLRVKEADSSTLSGLSLDDEWAEIQLYNGLLNNLK